MTAGTLETRLAAQRNPEARPQLALRDQLTSMADQYQLAMPKGLDASQLVRDALTCLSSTPKLAECDAKSVLGGLMTCAQLGLRPAVLGHAWLLPMWNKQTRGQSATLVIGYQGYLELIHRSGKVTKVTARKIREYDDYDVEYGDSEHLYHKPKLFGDKGQVIAYYATARFPSGDSTFSIMSKEDAEEHRDKFAMAKNKAGDVLGPWRDNFDAMALKTTVLKLSKYLPKSAEFQNAVLVDGSVRTNTEPKAPVVEVSQVIEPDGDVVPGEAEWVEPDPWAQAPEWTEAPGR